MSEFDNGHPFPAVIEGGLRVCNGGFHNTMPRKLSSEVKQILGKIVVISQGNGHRNSPKQK